MFLGQNPVSPRQNFLPIDDDKLNNTQESLWWDGKLLDVIYNDKAPASLAISTERLHVDVDFLTQLEETYS